MRGPPRNVSASVRDRLLALANTLAFEAATAGVLLHER